MAHVTLVEALEARRLLSGHPPLEPVLLHDINPQSRDISARWADSLDSGRHVFSAYGTPESGIFATDGTEAGTTRLASHGGSILKTPLRDEIYFARTPSAPEPGLMATDGTAGGTRLVREFDTATEGRVAGFLGHYAEEVYFTVSDPDDWSTNQLWRSDGTEAGTQRVGPDFNLPHLPDAVLDSTSGGRIWYVSEEAGVPALWVFELAHPAAPRKVADISRGDGSVTSNVRMLTPVSGDLYFVAYNNYGGNQLWRSDGTASGTSVWAEIYVGNSNISTSELGILESPSGPLLFFIGEDAAGDREPWVTDGTVGGTKRLLDINSSGHSYAGEFEVYDGAMYFSARDGFGQELWVSDGTTAGTHRVVDLAPGGEHAGPRHLTAAADGLYFSALVSPLEGAELFISDGTAAGTRLVADLDGARGSYPDAMTPMTGGGVLFVADVAPYGREIWKTRPSGEGADLVIDLNTDRFGSHSAPRLAVELAGFSLFVAGNGLVGDQLWRTDGTPEGTRQVMDVETVGEFEVSTDSILVIDGVAFFGAISGGQAGLWRTDGTADGTQLVAAFGTADRRLAVESLTLIDGAIWFWGSGSLRISDGTGSGTRQVSGAYGEGELTTMGSHVYFLRKAGSAWELWKTTGTDWGTARALELGGGTLPPHFATISLPAGERLLVAKETAMYGQELYLSNGTAYGTSLLKDLHPGSWGANPRSFLVQGAPGAQWATFTAGGYLWRTDGTRAGTVKIDIPTEFQYPNPRGFTLLEGEVYFTADDDGPTGRELWKTDGTQGGTRRLTDLNPGPGDAFVSWEGLHLIDGTIYFPANDGAGGFELWKWDQASESAVALGEIRPGTGSSSPQVIGELAGLPIVAAESGTTGIEPFYFAPDTTPPQVSASSFLYEAEQAVAFAFSEEVLGLEVADLLVINVTTGQTLDPGVWSLATSGEAATWTAAQMLPDGNYIATLPAGSVEDAAGNPLAEDATLSFFVLAGDADRDRDVDFFDFLKLRSNYGQSGKLFSDGDFDYDGDVDFFDFLILRGNYGVTLPPPGGSGSLFGDDEGSGGGGNVLRVL